MPPGAKKRKAAKKKKEQQASHNQTNSNNPLGNVDLKSQDERESNGSVAGSPASQDHHNDQRPFKEGHGEFKKWDPTPVRTFDSENKSMDEVARGLEGLQKGVEDDGAVTSERELKSEENSGSQSISIKDVEFVKESLDGSSSCSSSDNESQVFEKRMMKVESQNGENKQVDSFQKNVIHGTENASLGETDSSVVETTPIGHSDKYLVTESEEVIHVTQGDSFEISVVSDVVESLNENEESNRNEEKVMPLMGENVGASSTKVETMENENVGKILPTSVTPTETSIGRESIRYSKIPNSPENQPLVASAPRVEQRTSWMSCCGLFDVLTGSSG